MNENIKQGAWTSGETSEFQLPNHGAVVEQPWQDEAEATEADLAKEEARESFWDDQFMLIGENEKGEMEYVNPNEVSDQTKEKLHDSVLSQKIGAAVGLMVDLDDEE